VRWHFIKNWDIAKLDNFLRVDNIDNDAAKQQQEEIVYTGFLAQEVEKTVDELGYDFSGVVYPQNENSVYSIRYAEFVVPLVKAVQELSQQNNMLNLQLTHQQEEINQLKSELELIKGKIINQR